MSQYTPEQVERLAFRTDWMRDSELKRGEAAAMLRAYAATLKAAQGGVTEAINWSEFWNRISQNFDSADVDKVRACYKAALSAQHGQGAAWDARGGSLWLDREQWGVVIDALIEHRASAAKRKNGNPDSTSDVRADECGDLIGKITSAAKSITAPPAQPAERVPEGWVLVPRNPTKDQLRDGAYQVSGLTHSGAEWVYRAMLAASPSASPAPSPARGDGGDARSHRWDEDGERCVVCGDKDWMGGPCNGPRTATTQDTRP